MPAAHLHPGEARSACLHASVKRYSCSRAWQKPFVENVVQAGLDLPDGWLGLFSLTLTTRFKKRPRRRRRGLRPVLCSTCGMVLNMSLWTLWPSMSHTHAVFASRLCSRRQCAVPSGGLDPSEGHKPHTQAVHGSGSAGEKWRCGKRDAGETHSEKVRTHRWRRVSGAYKPCAQKTRCLPLWAIAATLKAKEALPSAPWHRGSFRAGRRTTTSRVKGKAKIGLSIVACPGSIGSVSHRMVADRVVEKHEYLKSLPQQSRRSASRGSSLTQICWHTKNCIPFAPVALERGSCLRWRRTTEISKQRVCFVRSEMNQLIVSRSTHLAEVDLVEPPLGRSDTDKPHNTLRMPPISLGSEGVWRGRLPPTPPQTQNPLLLPQPFFKILDVFFLFDLFSFFVGFV